MTSGMPSKYGDRKRGLDGPVVEQLALHGPVKDNQAVVAATSYPPHLAPCKFELPEQNPEILLKAIAGHQDNPGGRTAIWRIAN